MSSNCLYIDMNESPSSRALCCRLHPIMLYTCNDAHLQCFFHCLILQLQPHPSYPKMLYLVETTSLQPGEGGGPAQREGGLCTNTLSTRAVADSWSPV